MTNKRIEKVSSFIDKLLKIFQGFLIGAIAVAAIFIPIAAIKGDEIISYDSTLSIGTLKLIFADGSSNHLVMSNIKPYLIFNLCACILVCIIGWLSVRALRRILDPMKTGRPFGSGTSAEIKKLAWIQLIGGVIIEAAHWINSVLELKMYDLTAIFNPEVVKETEFNPSISLYFAASALVLFFLSYVFRCGEELQRESDETL